MSCGLRGGCFNRKSSADVGSGGRNEVAVRCPRGIDGVLLDKSSGGVSVERHAEEMGDAMIDRRGSDRFAVGRPGWCALKIERIGNNSRVRAVALHHVQKRLPVLASGEGNILSIARDRRAAKDLRSRFAPQLRISSVADLPDTLVCSGRRDIQK